MLNKIGGLLRDASLILGITILLLCCLEVGFSGFYLLKDRFSAGDLPTDDYHIVADAYPAASWVKGYWEEFARSKGAEWKPYVYWRRRPYRGNHINVNADGIRLTSLAEPGKHKPGRSARIFMFGGSTMWGTGARDAFTIPSILARELLSKGVVAEVTNFGESGYVSTQEVIALMLLLQKGDIPDLAIFYDGINDTYSAYQQHVSGAPQNEFNRVREFNLSSPDQVGERRAMVLQDIAAKLATMRFLRGLYWRFRVPNTDESATNPFLVVENAPFDSDALAQEVIDKFASNIELVKALSEHYGFKYVFYWQPTIFEKPSLTKYENAQREKMKREEPFFRKTYDVLGQSRLAGKNDVPFRDLSSVFSGVREPVFVDWSHLGETGNQIIARAMAHDALGAVSVGRAAAEQQLQH